MQGKIKPAVISTCIWILIPSPCKAAGACESWPSPSRHGTCWRSYSILGWAQRLSSFSLSVSASHPHIISCLGLVQPTASVPEPCYLKKKKFSHHHGNLHPAPFQPEIQRSSERESLIRFFFLKKESYWQCPSFWETEIDHFSGIIKCHLFYVPWFPEGSSHRLLSSDVLSVDVTLPSSERAESYCLVFRLFVSWLFSDRVSFSPVGP